MQGEGWGTGVIGATPRPNRGGGNLRMALFFARRTQDWQILSLAFDVFWNK